MSPFPPEDTKTGARETFRALGKGLVRQQRRWAEKFPGPFYSFWLHFSLFLMLIITPFTCTHKMPEVKVITVELLNVADITNVKPKEAPEPVEAKPQPKEEPKKEEPKPEPPEPNPPEPKPAEPEKKPEPKPVKKPEKKPDVKPVKKPEIKDPEKKPEKEDKKDKKKPKEDLDFDSVLKSVEKFEKTPAKKPAEKDDKTPASMKNESDFDANKPVSITEIEAIIGQISKCWSVPAGARDAGTMAVLLRLSLREDGSVTRVEFVDTARYNAPDQTIYRASADAAKRAVLKCSPLQGLPADKYESWKEMELNFDPRELIY